MSKNAEALRQERMKRLAASKAAAPKVAAPKKTASPDAPVADPTAKVVESEAVSEPEVVDQDACITAAVLDISSMSKTASLDASLYGKGTSNPHWLIVADGRPLGEFQFADADPSLTVDLFTSETYGDSVLKAMSSEGPAKIFASLKGRTYVAAVNKSAAMAELRKQVAASGDDSLRVARAEVRANLMNAVGLVLKAHKKNFLQANDLKAELHEQMSSVGVDPATATHVIETSWQNGAQPYFEATFDQAQEWMDLPIDAFAAIAKQVDTMPVRQMETVTAQAWDIPSSAHNVPVATPVTASTLHTASTEDHYRELFNLGGR